MYRFHGHLGPGAIRTPKRQTVPSPAPAPCGSRTPACPAGKRARAARTAPAGAEERAFSRGVPSMVTLSRTVSTGSRAMPGRRSRRFSTTVNWLTASQSLMTASRTATGGRFRRSRARTFPISTPRSACFSTKAMASSTDRAGFAARQAPQCFEELPTRAAIGGTDAHVDAAFGAFAPDEVWALRTRMDLDPRHVGVAPGQELQPWGSPGNGAFRERGRPTVW